MKDGGGTFRARFGVVYEEKQPDGSVKNVNLLSEGSYSKGSELTDGYPEFTYGVLKKLGWDKDLTEAELAIADQNFYSGNYFDAQVFATRAQQKLKRGTPAWLRAQDIIAFKAPRRKRG